MKDAIQVAVTLLALALVAQGKAFGQGAIAVAAKAFVASNSVEVTMRDGGKSRALNGGADISGIVAQIVAAPNADIEAACVWLLAKGCQAKIAGAEAKLESLSGDGSVDASIQNNATRAFVANGAKAKAKSALARLPVTDGTARAVISYAANNDDGRAKDEWFASAKAKGISVGQYRQWFLAQLKDREPADQLFDIQQEISGLMRSAENMETAKPWVEELRYRLYVAKEAAGQ